MKSNQTVTAERYQSELIELCFELETIITPRKHKVILLQTTMLDHALQK